MNAQHTPGRLVAEELDQDADYTFVIRQIDGDPYPLPVADCNRPADARRIVACWNACTGFRTETLERLGALDRAKVNARITLRTQRDELLEAAKHVMEFIEVAHRPPVKDEFEFGRMVLVRLHALAHLHAAIAKVEGGAS